MFAGQKGHLNGVHGHGQLNRMNNNNNSMESTETSTTADELLPSISVCQYFVELCNLAFAAYVIIAWYYSFHIKICCRNCLAHMYTASKLSFNSLCFHPSHCIMH